MAKSKLADIDDLLEEYEKSRDNRRACKVCESLYVELIDEMLRRGGGTPSITRFLHTRLGIEIGQSALARHRLMHLGDGQ